MDEPLPVLSAAEIRVLGSLIEKQVTTPDNYPLSLNALTNACNQLSSRDPVVSYDEQTVVRALDRLRDKRLAIVYNGADSRVARYKHAFPEAVPVSPAELALLCVLMLRGPQTVGELRSRSERLHIFESLPAVEDTLNGLATRQPPLVTKLPRQTGTKESRFVHLLAGPFDPAAATASDLPAASSASAPTAPAPSAPDRIEQLETQIAALQQELANLKRDFASFRQQFE
ncbi:YceH family protein [Opitutus sp. ER46]|uniref:YceH family protein n=1 Tax=Opitutus sp. ER46 TaxID=2161864 RepID=UPI000D31AAC9|nr:YceH family protein [Opitutus sp. ER46]PTY00361.1 DUF480 domain-containing protein [Opitutus sp. ER46]